MKQLILIALLAVSGWAASPTITVQPQSDSIAFGSDAVFTLTATGTDPLTVNWQQLFEEWQSAGTRDSLTVATQDSRQSVYRSVIVSPWVRIFLGFLVSIR